MSICSDVVKALDTSEEKLELTITDPENEIKDLIAYIAVTANTGHSFSVVVDPENDCEKEFYIDGDGSAHIYKINGKKPECNPKHK